MLTKSFFPRLLALLLFALMLPRLLAAQPTPPDPAFSRAQHLSRGINTAIWFAQSTRDYSVERLRTFTTEDDIALIEKLGFDHIRLSVDPAPLQGWNSGYAATPPFLSELDRVIDLILAHHISVILDIHPESPYKETIRAGTEGVSRFTALWTRLATRYKNRDPEHLFFEIMNEPEQSDPYRWIGIEARVADSIRAAAPQHTIIATGAHYSGLSDLLETEPLATANVIYTFHDYEPFPFSHQGATWTDARVRPLRGMPYPSTSDNVKKNLSQAESLEGTLFVEDYGLAQWGPQRVAATIAIARQWSDVHHVPIYCGEFGVLRDYADPNMRAAWLHDMVTALAANHIGWAMWDYQTNFGLVHKKDGITTPDPLIVQALGLHPVPTQP